MTEQHQQIECNYHQEVVDSFYKFKQSTLIEPSSFITSCAIEYKAQLEKISKSNAYINGGHRVRMGAKKNLREMYKERIINKLVELKDNANISICTLETAFNMYENFSELESKTKQHKEVRRFQKRYAKESRGIFNDESVAYKYLLIFLDEQEISAILNR